MKQHPDHCTCISVYKSLDRYDPTKTLALRNRWVKEMNRRFRRITSAINQAIVVKDVFGLTQTEFKVTTYANDIPIPSTGAFDFPTNQQKIDEFMIWINQLIADELLEVKEYQQLGKPISGSWTNQYVLDSYQRGVQAARNTLIGYGYDIPTLSASGGISAVMSVPFHMDRVGVLFARVFSDLKGITAAMDSQISKVLAQGMIDGKGPRAIAKMLLQTIVGGEDALGITDTLGRFISGKRRAEMLARTEVIRAHHQATIQEYENWGVAGVNVVAEWVTAGYNVCPECQKLEGKTFTLAEIRPMLPKHPHCRCTTIPVILEKGKKR